MKNVLLLVFLFNSALASSTLPQTSFSGQPARCQGVFKRTLLAFTDYSIKVENQFYHIGNKNFYYFQKLNHKLRMRNFVKEPRWLNLSELRHMHPVNYPIPRMWDKVARRIEAVRLNREAILDKGFSLDLQKQIIPSKAPIRVIRDRTGRFIVTDGNGRLHAIREAFGDNVDPLVEVLEYQTQGDEDVINLLEKIRAINHLED